MEVTLKGEKYYSKPVSVGLIAQTAELIPKFAKGEFLGDNYKPSELDTMIDFVVKFFGNQFSKKEFKENTEFEDAMAMMEFFWGCLNGVQISTERQMEEKLPKGDSDPKKGK